MVECKYFSLNAWMEYELREIRWKLDSDCYRQKSKFYLIISSSSKLWTPVARLDLKNKVNEVPLRDVIFFVQFWKPLFFWANCCFEITPDWVRFPDQYGTFCVTFSTYLVETSLFWLILQSLTIIVQYQAASYHNSLTQFSSIFL